jgi:hypothetical protein
MGGFNWIVPVTSLSAPNDIWVQRIFIIRTTYPLLVRDNLFVDDALEQSLTDLQLEAHLQK